MLSATKKLARGWPLFDGVGKATSAPQGKWGVGFTLPHFARELWKKPGEQTWFTSPRVAATRVEAPDKDGKNLGAGRQRRVA